MTQSLKLFQRNHVRFGKRPDGGPPQRRYVAMAAERPAKIAGERAHIGSLAALGREARVVRIGSVDQHQAVDVDDARLELEFLAVAGDVIGALAVDLDGGKARRHLLDRADKTRQQRRYRLPGGTGVTW